MVYYYQSVSLGWEWYEKRAPEEIWRHLAGWRERRVQTIPFAVATGRAVVDKDSDARTSSQVSAFER